MRVGFKVSLEEQQMDNPCVRGEEELTASVPGWAAVGTDQRQNL